jgi:hypothetical protein
MTAFGTKLPIRAVGSSVSTRGKPDSPKGQIRQCLTHQRH